MLATNPQAQYVGQSLQIYQRPASVTRQPTHKSGHECDSTLALDIACTIPVFVIFDEVAAAGIGVVVAVVYVLMMILLLLAVKLLLGLLMLKMRLMSHALRI